MNHARHALAAALILAATTASADVILSNASTAWYNDGIGTVLDTSGANDPFPCPVPTCGDATRSYPTAPNLDAASTALGNWLADPAAPGGTWSSAKQPIPLTWAVNSETAIIYDIDAGSGLTNLQLLLGVDNGVFVWLNGVYQFGARAGGGVSLGEYSLSLPDLAAGTHYLQVLREDHGGSTGFAISLTADAVTVPVPATAALLGIGLVGLVLTNRRRA